MFVSFFPKGFFAFEFLHENGSPLLLAVDEGHYGTAALRERPSDGFMVQDMNNRRQHLAKLKVLAWIATYLVRMLHAPTGASF